MSVSLKKLSDQVIVFTGASSGIGLATAEAAAKAGAKVVIAARSEGALNQIARRLSGAGNQVIAVACDVSERSQVERVAEAAVAKFGRIDTWVNNAGLGLYGRLDECGEADSRRLFDINFWGVVNGSQVALPHLKRNGGALINVGSEVSEVAAPLMGIYVASKHAVKGYTDVLRVELEHMDKGSVSITLIQPTAVNTPFPQHARNLMAQEPKLPDPTIDPSQVAEAILHAAEHHTRDKKVGAMSVINTMVTKLMPETAEKMGAKKAGDLSYDEPARNPQGILHSPSGASGVVGQTHGTGGKETKA